MWRACIAVALLILLLGASSLLHLLSIAFGTGLLLGVLAVSVVLIKLRRRAAPAEPDRQG